MDRMPEQECPFCRRLADSEDQAADFVWEFPHSRVILGAWQYYEGYCVVLSRWHVRELFELDAAVRHAFIDEVTQVASALERAFQPRKLNVEMLGNQVPHLHCHILPRSVSDPDHLKPVWVAIDLADRHPDVRQQLAGRNVDRTALIQRIREELSKLSP